MPGIHVTVPNVKLQPRGTPTQMYWVAGASLVAVGCSSRRTSIVGDVCNVAAP
jgi:hypothetical protein